jgi:hypothetical protein
MSTLHPSQPLVTAVLVCCYETNLKLQNYLIQHSLKLAKENYYLESGGVAEYVINFLAPTYE